MFTTINAERFLKDYWQQQSHCFRHAFADTLPNLQNMIDGNELAGLACEAEAESRIISGVGLNGDWRCQQGPFCADDFAQLPEQNWTLLMQGLDQWDVDVHAILQQFDFLPAWRLEDIMASYAPLGGGVGPHFDYYDVFLLQVSGTRQWQIGQQCDNSSALQANDQVKLLAEFNTDVSYDVAAGDMLYIPAGTAHWGTAISDDCITFSVGFRAPSAQELMAETLQNMLQNLTADQAFSAQPFSSQPFSAQQRYQDSLDSIDEHPHKINAAAQNKVLQLLSHLSTQDWQQSLQQAAQQAFGQLLTEPRHTPLEEGLDEQEAWSADNLIAAQQQQPDGQLLFNAMPATRLAFSAEQLFINGQAYNVDEQFAQAVCDLCINQPLTLQQAQLLSEWLNQGALSIV